MIPFFPSTSGKKIQNFPWKLPESNSFQGSKTPKGESTGTLPGEEGWKFGAKFPKGRGFTLKVQESNLTFMVEWEMIPIPMT